MNQMIERHTMGRLHIRLEMLILELIPGALILKCLDTTWFIGCQESYLGWIVCLTMSLFTCKKNGFMEDIKYFLNFCFGEKVYPDVLHDYLNYVVSLEFDTEPDYQKCREMFEKALNKELFPKKSKPSLLKAIGKLNEMDCIKESSEPLPSITHDITPAKGRKRRWSEPERPKFKFEVEENPRQSPRIKRRKGDKDSQNNEDNDTLAPPSDSLMSRMDSIIDNWSWERVIGSGNCELSELLLDHDSIASSGILTTDSLADEHRELSEKEQKESLANPTPAMKTILKRIKEKDKSPWQHQLKHTLGKTRMMKSPATKGIGRSGARSPTWDLTPNEFTPAMEIVMRKKSKSTFRRRFRSSGSTKETDETELNVSEGSLKSSGAGDNNVEITSTVIERLPESSKENQKSIHLKPVIKPTTSKQEKAKPTDNAKSMSFKTPTLRAKRSSSQVNKCTFM